MTFDYLEDRTLLTSTFSNLSSPTITYGTVSQTISGQLNSGSDNPIPADETVTVTLNNISQTAMLTNSGGNSDDFSTTFTTTGALQVPGSPYTLGFSYAGDANFTSASDSSTLTVNPATLTITASDQIQTYGFGGTSVALSAQPPAFTSSGLQNFRDDRRRDADHERNHQRLGQLHHRCPQRKRALDHHPQRCHRRHLSAASNYTIAYVKAPTDLTVNPRPLTIDGMTASNKPYDGTTTAEIDNSHDSLVGVIPGDYVNLITSSTASFSQADVGTNLTVSVIGFTIGGIDSDDYSLSQPTATANITPLALTITASDQTWIYGQGSLGTTDFTSSGLLSSDSISGVTLKTNASTSGSGNYNSDADDNNAPWTITPSAAVFSSGSSSEYSITYANAPDGLTVYPAPLTVIGISGTEKPYDGTTNDQLIGTPSLSGLVSGDNVTLGGTDVVGTLASASPGPEPVIVTGYNISGHDAGDYTLLQPTGLIVTVSNQAKPAIYSYNNDTNEADLTVPAGNILSVTNNTDASAADGSVVIRCSGGLTDQGTTQTMPFEIPSNTATLNVYVANDANNAVMLTFGGWGSSTNITTVQIGANPTGPAGAPPAAGTMPGTDQNDTVILNALFTGATGKLNVSAQTIKFVGGGPAITPLIYRDTVNILSAPQEPNQPIVTFIDPLVGSGPIQGFQPGDFITISSSTFPSDNGTFKVLNADSNFLIVEGQVARYVPSQSVTITLIPPLAMYSDTANLTSVNNLTLATAGVSYVGPLTINAAPATGLPFGGDPYLSGPEWGSYFYAAGQKISFNDAKGNGQTGTVVAVVGDNLYLTSVSTSLATGNVSDDNVVCLDFYPQLTADTVNLKVSGPGNSILGTMNVTGALSATTNNGNITIQNVGPLQLGTLDVAQLQPGTPITGQIQLTAAGSITGTSQTSPLTAAAVNLMAANTGSSIGTSSSPIYTKDVGALTATANDGGVFISNDGSAPLTVQSVFANQGGQPATVFDDEIEYRTTSTDPTGFYKPGAKDNFDPSHRAHHPQLHQRHRRCHDHGRIHSGGPWPIANHHRPEREPRCRRQGGLPGASDFRQ